MTCRTSDTYSDEEAPRRCDEALRRALNTLPQPKPSSNPKAVKVATSTNAKKARANWLGVLGPPLSGSFWAWATWGQDQEIP